MRLKAVLIFFGMLATENLYLHASPSACDRFFLHAAAFDAAPSLACRADVLLSRGTHEATESASHRKPRRRSKSASKKAGHAHAAIQRDTIVISGGYTPATLNVKSGRPVQLTFVSTGGGCANAIRIPSLNKSISVKPGQSKTITFTPKKNETITYSCTMGMYDGKIIADWIVMEIRVQRLLVAKACVTSLQPPQSRRVVLPSSFITNGTIDTLLTRANAALDVR